MQVCNALDYAHGEQIIHRQRPLPLLHTQHPPPIPLGLRVLLAACRDMKPSNIFLMADKRTVRIGDFGISKVLDVVADGTVNSEKDGRVGTKRYMAPEMLNRQDYSSKADMWSRPDPKLHPSRQIDR